MENGGRDAPATEEDMIHLPHLTEQTILTNLQDRYDNEDIYTSVGDILVCLNPFKPLPLYTPEMVQRYLRAPDSQPPHVFKVAAKAYEQMRERREGQAVVICGDSGAGKTETAKQILQLLVAAAAAGRPASSRRLPDTLLLANTVFEAFGNAQTLRNRNSSRFGKWTEVLFDGHGEIVGGRVVRYLLEKTRVVGAAPGERSYHVFYQLLARAPDFPELNLQEPSAYEYLRRSGVYSIEGVDDAREFDALLQALRELRLTEDQLHHILRALKGILLLGNIHLVVNHHATEEDGSKVGNPEVLAEAAECLGMEAAALEHSLVMRQLGAFTVILINRSVEDAREARDALAQALYARLFDWLIAHINHQLAPDGAGDGAEAGAGAGGDHTTIGILDIFGFESFDQNSFEQLCINYCNEKLQHHFTRHVVQAEVEEYRAEGVAVEALQFRDNGDTVALLEARGTGVLHMLQEEINSPGASDAAFLQKLAQAHAGHARFHRAFRDLDCFTVRHYAGEVQYAVRGFVEKNADDAPAFPAAGTAFMAELTGSAAAAAAPSRDDPHTPRSTRVTGRPARVAKQTKQGLGVKFKGELGALLGTIEASAAHFVRCVKPNGGARPAHVDPALVSAQLAACGLLDCVRVRQAGFPGKYSRAAFVRRFGCAAYLCGAGAVQEGREDAAEALVAALGGVSLAQARAAAGTGAGAALLGMPGDEGAAVLPSGGWARGRSRVYLKGEVVARLEACRRAARAAAAARCQAAVRARAARRVFARCQAALLDLHRATLAKSKPKMQGLLERVRAEGRCGGVERRAEVRAAEEWLAAAERAEEAAVRVGAVVRTVAAAGPPRDLEAAHLSCRSLEAGLEAAARAGLAPHPEEGLAPHPTLLAAQQLLLRAQEQRRALHALKGLVGGGAAERADVAEQLAAAEALGLGGALEARAAEQMRQLMEALEAATRRGDPSGVTAVMHDAFKAQVRFARLSDAPALLKRLEAQQRLQEALAARDLPALRAALPRAAEPPSHPPEYLHLLEAARRLVDDLEARDRAEGAEGPDREPAEEHAAGIIRAAPGAAGEGERAKGRGWRSLVDGGLGRQPLSRSSSMKEEAHSKQRRSMEAPRGEEGPRRWWEDEEGERRPSGGRGMRPSASMQELRRRSVGDLTGPDPDALFPSLPPSIPRPSAPASPVRSPPARRSEDCGPRSPPATRTSPRFADSGRRGGGRTPRALDFSPAAQPDAAPTPPERRVPRRALERILSPSQWVEEMLPPRVVGHLQADPRTRWMLSPARGAERPRGAPGTDDAPRPAGSIPAYLTGLVVGTGLVALVPTLCVLVAVMGAAAFVFAALAALWSPVWAPVVLCLVPLLRPSLVSVEALSQAVRGLQAAGPLSQRPSVPAAPREEPAALEPREDLASGGRPLSPGKPPLSPPKPHPGQASGEAGEEGEGSAARDAEECAEVSRKVAELTHELEASRGCIHRFLRAMAAVVDVPDPSCKDGRLEEQLEAAQAEILKHLQSRDTDTSDTAPRDSRLRAPRSADSVTKPWIRFPDSEYGCGPFMTNSKPLRLGAIQVPSYRLFNGSDG